MEMFLWKINTWLLIQSVSSLIVKLKNKVHTVAYSRENASRCSNVRTLLQREVNVDIGVKDYG